MGRELRSGRFQTLSTVLPSFNARGLSAVLYQVTCKNSAMLTTRYHTISHDITRYHTLSHNSTVIQVLCLYGFLFYLKVPSQFDFLVVSFQINLVKNKSNLTSIHCNMLARLCNICM